MKNKKSKNRKKELIKVAEEISLSIIADNLRMTKEVRRASALLQQSSNLLTAYETEIERLNAENKQLADKLK